MNFISIISKIWRNTWKWKADNGRTSTGWQNMNTTTVTFSLISFSSSQFYFYIFFFTFVSLSVSHSFSHYYFDQPRFLKIALAPKWQHDSLATLSSDGVKWLSTRIEIKKIFLNRFDFFLNNLHLFIFEWFLYFNFPKGQF